MSVDVGRVHRFEELATHLRAQTFAAIPERVGTPALPLFETFFTNHLAGTGLSVAETTAILAGDPTPWTFFEEDAELVGMYNLVADPGVAAGVYANGYEFLKQLRTHHAGFLGSTRSAGPGMFRTRSSYDGDRAVVDPAQVRGTLTAGFDLLQTLVDPFARAVFVLCLVAVVQPFAEGSNRVARLLMNGELSAAGLHRITVPVVAGGAYESAVQVFAGTGSVAELTALLQELQRYTTELDFSTVDAAEQMLVATNAFTAPHRAGKHGKQLILPSELRENWWFYQP